MITLGSRVRDKITGFEGIVMGRTEYYNGCIQYGVQPLDLKDGRPQKYEWIDEAQLVVVDAAPDYEASLVGGPHQTPPR
jgi:hypothetical protein